MIIGDLHFSRPVIGPAETEPIFVIDPYRMLPLAITDEAMQLVSRRHLQILERSGSIQIFEFPAGSRENVGGEALRRISQKHLLGRFVGKCLDHNARQLPLSGSIRQA